MVLKKIIDMIKKQGNIFSKIRSVAKNYTLRSLLYTLIFFTSCGIDEECRYPMHAPLRVGFYEMITDLSTGITTTTRVSIDTLIVQGIGSDSILGFLQASSIGLPLNKLSDASNFVFTFIDNRLDVIMQDVVSIYYEIHEDFLSFECGILTTFTIDSIRTTTTNNYIDSIVINSTEVNTFNNAQHIQIFRRTW